MVLFNIRPTLAPSKTHYRIISIDDHYLTCNLCDFETFGASFNVLELDNPFIGKDARVRIVGSFNGLLCITVDKSDIIIWNPSTIRVNSLPYIGYCDQSYGHHVGFGFGYDESNDDYKVVAISVMKRVKIYSLKSGCWKKLGNFPRANPLLGVMKVYEVQDSWTKLVSIPHITGIKIPKYLMPLCISHDDKVLLKLEKKLVLYDPKDSAFSEIQKIDYNCLSVDAFVESLVSPMPSGATN
ncbi:F-box associated domain containing protein [Tanacetum coccineum]